MFNYLLYRLGQFIALHTPLRISYFIASIISDLHYLVANKDHRRVKANLKAIFPDKSDSQIRGIRLRMSRNFAKYLVDFFRFEKIDNEYIKKNIRIENLDYFTQALSKGKGAIALTAHLGNWELGGVVIALLGYPFWAVALEHKDKRVNEFFNFQRESKGMKVIPLSKAVRACLNLLKENKIVALVGDRDFSQKGIVIDFFGRPTCLPEGPAAFSLKTGAPIVPGFMLRNKDDTFTLTIEKPIEFTPCGDKNKDLKELASRYARVIEGYIRRYPDQWYMFRAFWKDAYL
ncbi:MAG: lysophospholipid acyltransferase family protein [Candidatus Omnitrophica bacterium]|nr:lysophospholipid acyltransferase family protein [Candidatus Omnitrophota bacterium]